MARTAKGPDGETIEAAKLTRKSFNLDERTEAVLTRVIQLIPAARGEKSAAIRWMAVTIDPMLENLAAGMKPEDIMKATTTDKPDLAAEWASASDVYRLGYAAGVYDAGPSGNATRLSPAVLDGCVLEPGRALSLHLVKHRKAMAEDMLVVQILGEISPAGLPERATDSVQGEFWIGYYHGRGRKHHKQA